MTDLAARAVACPAWRWMAGMSLSFKMGRRARVVEGSGGEGGALRVKGQPLDAFLEWSAAVPDLDDPATMGCLLALVQEGWDDPHIYMTTTVDGFWRVNTIVIPTADPDDWCKTAKLSPEYFPGQAEALVDALESLP